MPIIRIMFPFEMGYILIAGSIVFAVWQGLRAWQRQRFEPAQLIMQYLLCLYATAVFSITLMPTLSPMPVEAHPSINLMPLAPLYQNYAGQSAGSVRAYAAFLLSYQVTGNVMMFVPLGILTPFLWRWPHNAGRMLLLGLAVSLGIEALQLLGSYLGLMYRTFDVDDLIFNTLGCLIGYALHWLIRRLLPNVTPYLYVYRSST